MSINRRDFLMGGIKGTAAYTLLASTMLASNNAMADESEQESSDPSEDEIKHLEYMREEEKLARDVYLTMYETWGLPVFARIAESEQVHTDAVKAKIEKYGLVDPVDDDSVGVFVNTDLAVLYDTLILQGQESELDALYVGGAIEEIDMIDIIDAIEHTDSEDVIRTYQNLLKGSESHLRAFVSQIEMRDVQYQAQYLPQEEVDAIINYTNSAS